MKEYEENSKHCSDTERLSERNTDDTKLHRVSKTMLINLSFVAMVSNVFIINIIKLSLDHCLFKLFYTITL